MKTGHSIESRQNKQYTFFSLLKKLTKYFFPLRLKSIIILKDRSIVFFKKCFSRWSVLISVTEVNLGYSGRGNT